MLHDALFPKRKNDKMIYGKEGISEFPDVSKPTQRRLTGTTTSSRSTDFTESMSEEMSFAESCMKQEDCGLARTQIKHEMVQSLTRVAAARLRKTPNGQSNMKDAEAAIRKLATMVLDGEENEDHTASSGRSKIDECKPDQKLRDLLRQALVVGDDEDAWSADLASTTETSGIDVVKHDTKDAPIDIWHPDFWVEGEESINGASNLSSSSNHASASNLSNSNHAGSSACPSRSSGVRTEGEDSSAGRSLQDFLANLKEISSDSDESDDDMSVLSDITGLTECFPEDEERRTVAKEKRSQVLLDAVPSMKSMATKRNRDGQSKVVFADVCIRKYERILCDNPACTSGPSLGVGWLYKVQPSLSVDEYEKTRGPLRGSSDLMLDRATREKMVRRMGCSEKEIAEMTRSVNKTKFQRRQTLNNLGVEKMEYAVEMAKRRFKSFLFLKGKGVKTDY